MTVLKWMKFSEEGYATNTKARTHIEEGILDIHGKRHWEGKYGFFL